AERALDHPAPRQQHKAVLGRGQFDDFQSDAVGGGILGSLLTSVALVDKRDLDRLTGHLLDLFGQFGYLCALLLIGRRDQQGQQLTPDVHCDLDLAAALGCGAPSAISRNRERKSWTRTSKTPAFNQRWVC